jgi:hypothetical protein
VEGDTLDAVLQVRGMAAWQPAAWGVARALWVLQADERRETNRIVRREHWRLVDEGGTWLAVARHPLAPFEILDARIEAGVYPGQDAMLVDCTWYVRALADGVRNVRVLLDRRAHVYDLRVDGRIVDPVRGSELGSLGLWGWSPESESSFELPDPLAAGARAAIRIRLRAPLVHVTGNGFVTTVPLTDGAFRERLWMPVPDPAFPGRRADTEVTLSLRWPAEAFAGAAVACPRDASVERGEAERLEERTVTVHWKKGQLADVDFALFTGATPPLSAVGGAPVELLTDGVFRFVRDPAPPGEPSWRTRDLVFPPLYGATQVSRDLSSELQDLLPLDDRLLDEIFDDSAADADRGSADREQ